MPPSRSIVAAVTLLLAASLLLDPGTATAQTYRPHATTASPLVLLDAPPDPVAYYETQRHAWALYEEKRHEEAEPLAERLTREYPRDGMNWVLLARIRSALDRHAEAAAAYQRAGPLIGWGFWHSPRVNAAGAHVAAGNHREALDLLRQEMFDNRSPLRLELNELPYLAPLRSDPEFLEIAGRPDTTGWSRDYGWRRDLEYLRAELKRVNPDYHSTPLPPAFERSYSELWRQIPQLSDHEIYVGMNRMLAVLRQGHTSLFSYPDERRLPVAFYAFPEGLFIINATDEHRALVGSQVLAFGEVPATEALRLAGTLLSVDGDMEYVMQGPTRLRQMSVLLGLGIASSMDSLRVSVRSPGGQRRTVVLPSISQTGFPSNRLAPAPGVETPLFLRHLDRPFWEQHLPEHDAHYVQVNGIQDASDETLPAFGRRLWTVLGEARPGNLILDLRHNGGGATALYPELLRTVIAFSRTEGHAVYVLIGRRTYSAAANLITDLERLVDPIFVGEASSECCNFYGDFNPVRLPYSGIGGVLTAVKWNLSRNVFDGRREMSPQVPVQLKAADHFAGRDAALEAVLRMIGSGRRDAAENR